MKQPEDVQLSRDEGEALIERIERNVLSAEDRQLLVKLLTFYFWLLFALREAKLSLKRLKALVFGEKPQKPTLPSAGETAGGGRAGERDTQTSASPDEASSTASSTPEKRPTPSGAWAPRSRCLSSSADGGVPPRSVSGRRALSGLWARAVVSRTAGRGDAARWPRVIIGGAQ
jgi:hypothetical protein